MVVELVGFAAARQKFEHSIFESEPVLSREAELFYITVLSAHHAENNENCRIVNWY